MAGQEPGRGCAASRLSSQGPPLALPVCAGRSGGLDPALTRGLDPRWGLRAASKRVRGSEVTGGGKWHRNERALYRGVSGAGEPRSHHWPESLGRVLLSPPSGKGHYGDESQVCEHRPTQVKHEESCLPCSKRFTDVRRCPQKFSKNKISVFKGPRNFFLVCPIWIGFPRRFH